MQVRAVIRSERPELNREEMVSAEAPISIGRHVKCVIRLESDLVSRQHAVVTIGQRSTVVEDQIRVSAARPFSTDYRASRTTKKSVFNRIVGEPHAGGFELLFADFLDNPAAVDVKSFTKNYHAIGFRLDYVKTDGDLSTYTPDFLVKTTDGTVWIIETKGREELDVPRKMARLRQWCADATEASRDAGIVYRFVYVAQLGFETHRPKTFAALAASFTEYQDA